VVALLACLIAGQASAGGIHCPLGDPVTADLGDGVIMRTCLWEKEPQLLVRAGPLELIKNGVLILKTQTNRSGKLHGQFTSWDDNGKMIESGVYDNGLKEGPWSTIDEHGISRTSYYRQGVRIEP
jgi:hypothetical protein